MQAADFETSSHYLIDEKHVEFGRGQLFEDERDRYINLLSEDESKNALYSLTENEHSEGLYRAIRHIEAINEESNPGALRRIESMPNCYPIALFKKERIFDNDLEEELKEYDVVNDDFYYTSMNEHLNNIRRSIRKSLSGIISNHTHDYHATYKYTSDLQNFKLSLDRDVMWLNKAWDDQSEKMQMYFESKYKKGDPHWEIVNKEEIEKYRDNLWMQYDLQDKSCDAHIINPEKLKTFEFKRHLKDEDIALLGFYFKNDPTLNCYRNIDIDKYMQDLKNILIHTDDGEDNLEINCKLVSSKEEKEVVATGRENDIIILKDREGQQVKFDVNNHPSDWLLFIAGNSVYRKHDFFDTNILFVCRDMENIQLLPLFIPTVTEFFDCEEELHDVQMIQDKLRKYFNTSIEELTEYEFIYMKGVLNHKKGDLSTANNTNSVKRKNTVKTLPRKHDLWGYGILTNAYLSRRCDSVRKLASDVELFADEQSFDIFSPPRNTQEVDRIIRRLQSSRKENLRVVTDNKYQKTKQNIEAVEKDLNILKNRSISYFEKPHEVIFKGMEDYKLDRSENVDHDRLASLSIQREDYGDSALTANLMFSQQIEIPAEVESEFYNVVRSVGMRVNQSEYETMYARFNYCWTKLLEKKGDLIKNPKNRIFFIYACIAIFGQVVGREFDIESSFTNSYSLNPLPWVAIIGDKSSDDVYKNKSLFSYLTQHFEAKHGSIQSKLHLLVKTILRMQNDIRGKLEAVIRHDENASNHEEELLKSNSKILKYMDYPLKNERKEIDFQSKPISVNFVPRRHKRWIIDENGELMKDVIRNFVSVNALQESILEKIINVYESKGEYGLGEYFSQTIKENELNEIILIAQESEGQMKRDYVYESEFDMNNEIIDLFKKNKDFVGDARSHLLSGRSQLKNALIREESKFYLHYIVLFKKSVNLQKYLDDNNYDIMDTIIKYAKVNHKKKEAEGQKDELRRSIKVLRSEERQNVNQFVADMSEEEQELYDSRVRLNLSAPAPDINDDADEFEQVLPEGEQDGDNES